MEGNEQGAFVDIVIGIAGSLVGGFALHFLGFKARGKNQSQDHGVGTV